MKNKFFVSFALLFFTNCVPNFNKSGPGFIFTSTTDPVFFDNNVKAIKKGESCSVRALALVATGDASIKAAKANGDISKVATADTEYFNVLGIFGKACTVVRGE